MPRRTRRHKGGMATRVHTTSMPANYDQPPGLFASNAAGVAGHGSPYNYYAQPGAAGRLSPAPYTTGQAGGTKCSNSAPTGYHVMGPNNGGSFDYGQCGSPERSLGMGAGKQVGGRMCKTRKRGKKGTKSKTHRGKDFETRKSSKRYGEKRWRKFLRGRKTMIAPDFPFAGGALKRGRYDDDDDGEGVTSMGNATTPDSRKSRFGCFANSGAVELWLGNQDFRCGDRPRIAKKIKTQQGGYRYSQKRRQGRRNKSMRGGYHVPGSNVPNAPSYSTGGILHGGLSALANPVPYQRLDNCIPNDFPIRH